MNVLSGEISGMVFRRIVRKDMGEFSFDSHLLSVLMEMDGRQKVVSVAEKTGLSLADLREMVSKLLELKLIEPAQAAVKMLDNDFFDTLNAEMALAVGPIAEVIIEDAVGDLGLNLAQVPSHRAAELVELLAREIQRDEKKVEFKQNMISKMKEKGY